MRFGATEIPGVVIVDIEPHEDERGFFARTFSSDGFARRGMATTFREDSISFNRRKGTVRGLHLQAPPHEEAKLVRVTSGSAFDVVVDLRTGSETHARWIGLELSAENRRMVYVPEGCAHGFQTLEDGTEVFYRISAPYDPDAARGIRFDDPSIRIEWPLAPTVVSERDRSLPVLSEVT